MQSTPPSARVAAGPHPVARVLGRWALAAATLALAPWPPAVASTTGGATAAEVVLVLRQARDLPALQTRHGLSLTGRFGARPIFRLRVPAGADADAVVAALSAEPTVVAADRNTLHSQPGAVKNNVLAIGSPQAYAAQWAGEAIGLPQAQALGTGRGVRVAVLDTGFDLSHPALAGRLLPGRDFVDGDNDPADPAQPGQAGHGHGTHVAGLVAWAAPGARILPLRVLDTDGQGHAWVLAEAMLHALDPDGNPATADGAQVINLSLAGLDRTRLMDTLNMLVSCTVPGPEDLALVDLSDPGYNADRERCATQGGAVVVVGAGNDGSSSLRTWPAAESAYGLMAVGASNGQGRVAAFSNRGGWIDLVAPGDAVTSSVPGGGYATWSGTSMAAPLVSGAAALVLGRQPAMAPRDVSRCLTASSEGLRDSSKLRQLDVGNAMRLLASGGPRRCR